MKKWWRYLHWFIILNFLAEIFYGFYMVFFVVGGGRYPLWSRAVETPMEVILKRRLFAIEVWIAISGLAVYLALTRFLPRILQALQNGLEAQAGSPNRTNNQ